MDSNKLTMRALRTNAGVSSTEAAEALKVSRNTLLKWERGETYPNALQLFQMAALYKCTVDSFLIQ